MSEALTTPYSAPALIEAFKALQSSTRLDALSIKVKMFYLGLIVKELSAAFRQEYGETRGRKAASDEIGDTLSPLPAMGLKEHLEEALGVTYRTCNRYLNFWEGVTNSDRHAKAVAALNKVWSTQVEALQLEAAPKKAGRGGKPAQPLALQDACMTLVGDLQGILEEADDLGLHELFEKPLKDVTPTDETEEDPETAAERKEKIRKFWLGDFAKRLGNNEFLKLPKTDLETLVTDWEEALAKAKDRLKTTKGKGKA